MKKNIFFILSMLLVFVSCNETTQLNPNEDISESIITNLPIEEVIQTPPLLNDAINFSHFNHLYKDIILNKKKVGIVHIYSEYPNYDYAIEPKEGFTCVDDVARAIIMLSKYLELVGNDAVALEKLKNLTEFVLQLQNKNGYFNNFLWGNLSINTTYRTSIAVLDWWSLRALWALESAYPFLESNKDISNNIILASQKLLTNIKRDLPITNLNTEFINSIELPTWLPGKSASDQAAVLMLGLLKNYTRTSDNDIKLLIDHLAKGMMLMQKGDPDKYPYGAFLSSENLWHAWGNNQAIALLKVGQYLNNQEYIDSALMEVDNFYPKLLNDGFAEAFWIKKEGSVFSEIEKNSYPQIAYGLRPMVWAASEAFQYSNNEKHLDLSRDLEAWLSGKNDANKVMYNPLTGVCFDGIVGPNEVNKNSGAESTIESLMILLEIEKYD